MYLSDISILNYKNIADVKLSLSPKMNCLIGHNGEGKTNFLDAVYYLSFCRSAYTAVDSNVIRHNENCLMLNGVYTADVAADLKSADTENIYCGMKRGSRKHFKRNKKEYRRLSMHIGLIPLILISPSDSLLIDGGGEERRRLMDVVISQYDHSYIEALSRYNKALQQRNSFLKQDEEPDPTLMDILEEQMAAEGEAVYSKRGDFINGLEPLFQHYYQSISNGREEVSLRYVSHCHRGRLIDVIRGGRPRDRAVGYSLHGIHRDDIEMLLDGYPVRREGSQGQSKTFVIALKLAQFSLLKRTSPAGRTPMLLLDDIFDKLDSSRVAQIVRLVSGDGFGQIFITDTNRTHLDDILQDYAHDYKIFAVDDGRITLREERHVQA